MLKEQKEKIDMMLKKREEELKDVVRRKNQDIRAKQELMSKIAACDRKIKEVDVKLFAAEADIIMEEYTEMEESKKTKELLMVLEELGGARNTNNRVPDNG